MSVVNKQIAAVEFQADARQANQAIESMRLEADKCNKKVELLQERLSKGIKTIKIEGRDTDINKEIKNQQRLARSYNDAAAALMKGVKAWDELWKHYKTGDIEALTGQQIKAGINGAKRQYDRLLLGDEEDRKKALAIKAIVDEATIVLDKLKGSTNEVIQTLRDGGHVADEVLQREKKYLEDMLGLTEKFSPEWQDYNRQLQDVNKYIAQQAAEEKRLRGELVDANDARREAEKLNQQTADAAKKEHEAQQKVIDDAKAVLQQREDELRLHKENAQKKSEEIAQQDQLINKQNEVVESVKRENREINKKSGSLNKAAREADNVADRAKRAADKSAGEVNKLAIKLADAEGKVRDLQGQLDKLGNTKAQPKVDTAKIDQLRESLKDAKKELSEVIQDEKKANEQLKQFGITAADVTDDTKLQAAAERALKIEEQSRMELQKNLLAMRKDVGERELSLKDSRLFGTKASQSFYNKNKDVLNDEYWNKEAGGSSISRKYKYLQDISDDPELKAEFEENVGMSVKDAMRVAGQRMRQIVQEAVKRGFKIDYAMDNFDESYGKGPAVKIADYLADFNDEVDEKEKKLIEQRRKKFGVIQDVVTDPGDELDSPEERLKNAKADLKYAADPYSSGASISAYVEEQRKKVADLEAELKKLNETGSKSVSVDKERQRLTEKLNKAKQEQADIEAKLNEKTQEAKRLSDESVKADGIAAAKRDELNKAQADGNKRLQEESQKLSDLQAKRNEDVNALNKEKEAIKQTTDAANEQGKIIHDAQQKQAQNRQLSIDSIEKAIELLKQENRVIGDETNPQWVENEKTIGRLNQRLSEMKQHAAELRGEAMSVAEAVELANRVVYSEQDTRVQQQNIDAANAEIENQKKASQAHQANIDNLNEEIKLQDQQITNQQKIVDGVKATLEERKNHFQDVLVGQNKQLKEDSDKLENAKKVNEEWRAKAESADNNVKQLSEQIAQLDEEQKKANITESQAAEIEKKRVELNNQLVAAKEQQSKVHYTLDLTQKSVESWSKVQKMHIDDKDWNNRDYKDVIQDLDDKYADELKKLEKQKAARQENLNKLAAEKAAINENSKAIDEQTKKIREAQAAQAKGHPDADTIRKAINALKEENSILGDETNPQWMRNEMLIGKLNSRLEEMKQKSAVLRGEVMSLGEAVNMAGEVSEKNGPSRGNYSIEQMQQGLDALEKGRQESGTPAAIKVINESIDILTQKIREAKGEAVSLDDALNFGKQGLDGSFKGTTEQLRQAKQVLEQTLDHTAKGEDKYKEIREALAGIAIEEKRVGGVTKEMQAVLDQPKGRSFNELKLAVEQGRKALNDMGRATKEEQQAYDALAEKVKAADLELKNVGNTSKGAASSFEKAVSRLKTYITLYMGTAVAIQKLTATMGDVMTLSDKMGEVRKTTGFTAEQVGKLSNNLAKLDTRTPIQNLMDLAAVGGQLGLTTEEDVQGFAEAANKMLVALPEMGQDGAEQMMKIAIATKEVDKIRKQMEEGTVSGSSATAVAMEKIASTIDRLRATTAAAAPPIADFVKRVGAVGAQSGISVDQVAALGATVDSLGMGTEMAATAISRMIPAIKNHAFDIAQVIGVTPKTIRDLYDSGKAMDVILMILQHIHDQNLNPDGIEKLLGTGGMGEIMKELDQQGARAGIVFAGLSQNVGELRTNLNTAKEAYRDNIAIQQEYDKMNDTTAAKWERLKNKLQEFLVNDANQRFLGGIISALRVLVNLITDDGPIGKALRFTAVYLAMLKAKWTEAIGSGIMYLGKLIFTTKASTAASAADATTKAFETTSTVALGNANAAAAVKTNIFTAAWHKLNAAQKANVIAAVAMAVVWLTVVAIKYVRQLTSMTRAQKEMNKVQDQAAEKAAEESGRLENLRKIVNDNTKSVKERRAAILEIQKVVPHYIATVNGEGNAYKRNTELLNAYIKKLKEKALVEGAKQEMQSLGKEIAHTTVEITKQKTAIKNRRKEAADAMQTRPQTSQGAAAPMSVQGQAGASMEILGMQSKLRSLQNKNREANDALQTLQDSFGKQIAESDLANSPGGGNGNGNGNGGNGGGGGTGGTGGTGGGTDKNNPWGTNADAASTNWSKLTGKQLVERRKQMNDFVKSLQWDTDVESVLSEDPALMKAMKEGKVKKDTDSVIAWYNKQRLAIQDELHSRFLTNTGNWQDPKKAHQHAKSASKMAKDDMSYYLDELDAYYTERKSKIEEAQNDGEITEAEGWRRTLDNERIWQQRRAELQQLYANKSSKVTKDEQDAIFNILSERTGDNTGMIEAQIASTLKFIKAIGEKSEPAMRRIFGDLDLGVEQSFLKMRTAVKKQLEAINDIIDKERPFNGIVRNLETNISKMGLLIPDINKKLEVLNAAGKSKSKEADALNELAQYQNPKRLTFLLQESESAYQMTWDKFEADLRKNGFGDWADAIVNSDNAERDKEAILAQLRTVYDDVQDAIKKEASEVKKQVDIAWNDTVLPGGVSIKQTYERAANALGVEQGRVSRANSMIGAGTASERVADKLAIKQMEIQLQMQTHYYNLVRKTGEQRVADLKRQEEDARKRGDINKAEQLALDAKHAKMSLNLTLSEEETDLAKQREEIIARTEESEAKLYSSLKEWGTLLSSSLQGLFEASNTGAADYYNNLAKMRLTGEGSGGGTYVIIDNAGTKDAKAHYETLDGEDALKRQLEIEQQNAVADEWKKVMDDINKKISDQITDWMNAALQNQAMDANTTELVHNTAALDRMSEALGRPADDGASKGVGDEIPNALHKPKKVEDMPRAMRKRMGLTDSEDAEASTKATQTISQNDKKQVQSATDKDNKIKKSAKSTYSAMASAMNMYGLAYQVMSNENMSSTQKFLTFALQSAGQVAIAMLTTNMLQTDAQSKIELPGILGKAASQLGPIAGPIAFAAMTALLGGLMAVATSKVSKSKSQISQVTGASVSAGRLSTGMLTYAEGNVNEFTDPSTLTPGQQYNVDAADGHTYRARYMGSNPTTHLTNGPEFHLVGERGREAIIDANTTRQLQMNDTGIWNAIQTLYNGGSIRSVRRSGMRNFATGNLDDFADSTGAGMTGAADGATETTDVVSSLQASLDRNSDVLERAMRDGIKGVFDIHGKGGLVDSYDRGKKEANRHGEKY